MEPVIVEVDQAVQCHRVIMMTNKRYPEMTSSLKMNLISMLEDLKDTDIDEILYKRKEKISSYGKFERS